jgi:hypothetical protein
MTRDEAGKAHPRENALAEITLVCGLIAVVTSIWPGLHLYSSWFGLVGIAFGAYSQMISATRAERFLNVIGFGAAALGFGLGLAHGGPFGGLIG